MGQTAAFDVVGIIGQVNLHLVVDSAGELALLFTAQIFQKCGRRFTHLRNPVRLLCCIWDIPGLTGQKRIWHSALGAVVSHRSF